MGTIATFIGIDRHAAPDVRDLVGARRDAVALRCLFADSVSDVNATMLCDEARPWRLKTARGSPPGHR
jgi:hypothetical protein